MVAGRFAAALLAGLACASAAAPARAWDDATHERVARLAVRLMPPALAGELERNAAELVAAARAGDGRPAAEHWLHVDGSGGTLDRDVAASVERAVALVRGQRPFRELAEELGRLSHLAADAAFPLATSASDPSEEAYFEDYARYAGSKLDRFPAVFEGYERFDRGFDPAGYVRSIAERANRRYPFIGAAYFPEAGGPMRSSRTFDDRGPAFGVTQLSFVSAVSATANLWLYVWREAHGDLGGTPHFPAAHGGAAPGATGRARAAERPR